jgi:hypothetical protein
MPADEEKIEQEPTEGRQALHDALQSMPILLKLNIEAIQRLAKSIEHLPADPQNAASMLMAAIQMFVGQHPTLPAMQVLRFVNAFFGATSVGKDKVLSWVVGKELAVSSSGVCTHVVEKITQIHDPGRAAVEIEMINHFTGERFAGGLEQATVKRKIWQMAIEGFPDSEIAVNIFDPSPTASSLTLYNFPGTVAIEPGRTDILRMMNRTYHTMKNQGSGVIYFLIRGDNPVWNDPWLNLDVFQERERCSTIQVVFVFTFGDLLNVRGDYKTYAEYDEGFFGAVRRLWPDAECIVVSNWAEDTIGQMETGLQKAAAALEERIRQIDQNVRVNNGGKKYRGQDEEREKLLSCFGNDRLRQHFWKVARLNVSQPLRLLGSSFQQAVGTLADRMNDWLDDAESISTVEFGHCLRKFTLDFAAARPMYTLGASPRLGQANSPALLKIAQAGMRGLQQEFDMIRHKLPEFPSLPLRRTATTWAKFVENCPPSTAEFSLHMLLKRFWTVFDDFMLEVTLPLMNMDLFRASEERTQESGIGQRLGPFFKHILCSIQQFFAELENFLPNYVASMTHHVACLTHEFVMEQEEQKLLRNHDELTGKIKAVIEKIYAQDLALKLKHDIRAYAQNIMTVDEKLEETLTQIIQGDWTPDEPLSFQQNTESFFLQHELTPDILSRINQQATANFTLELRRHMDNVKRQIVVPILKEFHLWDSGNMEESNFLFKHIVLQVLDREKLVEAVANTDKVPFVAHVATRPFQLTNMLSFSLAMDDNAVPIQSPYICEQEVVAKNLHLRGLVWTWNRKQPYVFCPSYFEPLDEFATNRVTEYINNNLQDSNGKLFVRLLANVQHGLDLAQALQRLVGNTNQFFVKAKELRVTSNDALCVLAKKFLQMQHRRVLLQDSMLAATVADPLPQDEGKEPGIEDAVEHANFSELQFLLNKMHC